MKTKKYLNKSKCFYCKHQQCPKSCKCKYCSKKCTYCHHSKCPKSCKCKYCYKKCSYCHHSKCPKSCKCRYCSKNRKCSYCQHRKCPKSCKCKKCIHKRTHKRKGGSFYKPAAPIPGPFVGQPIGNQPSTWPGENGISSDRNYYSENLYKVDPQTMMKLGGKKTKKRSKKGGLGPFSQGIVNIGRSLGYNWGSASNQIRGYDAPINPLPWKDQLTLNKSIY